MLDAVTAVLSQYAGLLDPVAVGLSKHARLGLACHRRSRRHAQLGTRGPRTTDGQPCRSLRSPSRRPRNGGNVRQTENAAMDKPSLSPSPALEVKESPSGVPRFFAAVALLLGAGYPALVLAGKVQPTNRLTAAEIALVLVAMTAAVVVVSPRFLGSIRKLKLSGFELELDQVREQQQRQRARLVEIDMLLPLLMPDAQFRHLENLVKRTTTKYRGGSAVREELRKLASSGLI